VDGYVVLTPNRGAEDPPREILLQYPDYDPESSIEFFGVMDTDKGAAKVQQGPKGRSFHNGR
jgi:hypothetical protein